MMTHRKVIPGWFWRFGGGLYILLLIGIIAMVDLGRFPFYLLGAGWDVVGHFVLIGFAAFFLNGLLGGKEALRIVGIRLFWADLLVLGLALLEETSQILLLTRSFSFWDALADFLGILVFGRMAIAFLPDRRATKAITTGRH